MKLTDAKNQYLLAWNQAMSLATVLNVSYTGQGAESSRSGTGANNKEFTYNVVVIVVVSNGSSGASSPRHDARMPDGKPWVVRVRRHHELWRAAKRGWTGRVDARSPSLQ